MAGGHGGSRRGAGRPLGRKNLRPGTSAALIEAARINENLIPVKFEGDSLEFLRAAMSGKIWPTREQLFAARSVLPIEHPPATSVDGRSVDEIREEVRREIFEERRRDGEAARKQLEHEIRRRREVIVEHRDAKLKAWINAGGAHRTGRGAGAQFMGRARRPSVSHPTILQCRMAGAPIT
jgi:hypothetical protein